MQPQILDILHLGHFGMQRMKQLARSAVYWPHIDSQIEDTCRGCVSCAEHQNKPLKSANHPWMMPEKPWSRIHVDHAINFMSNNWLIVTDAYSKYPCIHQTSSTSTQATTTLLEEDFAHFGYPHTIVSDNIQFCRVPAMVPPERHQTPDWRSLPSSHQWSRREDGAVFQAVTEEFQAAATTSATGVPDAVSPYSTQHWLLA